MLSELGESFIRNRALGNIQDLTVITWLLVGVISVLIAYFHGPSYSIQTVKHAPSILTSLGIFGTFLGIAFGLMQFDSADIEASVPTMIDGLGVAVWSSITGIIGALSIRLRYAVAAIRHSKQELNAAKNVADLYSVLQSLNENMSLLRKESDEHNQAQLEESKTFQAQLVSVNTEALTRALSEILTDFNSQIDVQYGENFKEFNEAVGQLLTWQQSYSQQLNSMLEMQESSLKVISTASDSYEEMIEHSQEFNAIAGSLGELLKGLEQQTSGLEGYLSGLSGLVSQASEGLPALSDYVAELTVKLSSSIEENNKSLTQVLSQASRDITMTVQEVSKGLSESVEHAHSGLADHISAVSEKTKVQSELLDQAMEKELTQALQTFGYQLTALSEKFVNDYMPLTNRLKEVVSLAESVGIEKKVKGSR